ncbi:MAG: hypothetical protein HY514_01590 [Candidatus Aenigmarchaeota archaeon]|nr:hypothetical protein [Candidatus Aenigmarchaeota archaeon]
MEVRSQLGIPREIIQHVSTKANQAREEREELGLALPPADIPIGVNFSAASRLGSFTPDKIEINIARAFLEVKDVNRRYQDLSEFFIYLDLCTSGSEEELISNEEELISNEEFLEMFNSNSEKENLLIERLEQLKKSYKQNALASSSKSTIGLLSSSQNYLRSDKAKKKRASYLHFIVQNLPQYDGTKNDVLLYVIRHEMDHAAWKGNINRRHWELKCRADELIRQSKAEGEDPDLAFTRIPDKELRELFHLEYLTEAGAYVFNIVPYRQWSDFSKKADKYRDYIETQLHEKSYFFPRIHEGLQNRMIRHYPRVFTTAYSTDPRKLKAAYENAQTPLEFAIMSTRK